MKTPVSSGLLAGRFFTPDVPTNQITILKEGEEIITDKTRIAETFNGYFINIANYIKMPASNEYGQDFANHPSVVAIKQRRPDALV